MSDLIILEAGRRERHYWRDLWRYRELFRVLAWRDLSVRYKQTVIGVAVGSNSACSNHASLHDHLRPNRATADGWYSTLSVDGLCRHIAMDLLFQRIGRGFEQPDQQCEPDQQSLLPAAYRAYGDGGRGFRGLPHQLLHASSAYGLVPIYARLADPGSPRVCPAGILR